MTRIKCAAAAILGMVGMVVSGCSGDGPVTGSPDERLRQQFNLQGLGETPYPVLNPLISDRVLLGRLLFYDPILSGELDISCGTCHHPDFAFADGRQFGAGTSGIGLGPGRTLSTSRISGHEIREVGRNTPTVLNAAMNGDSEGHPSVIGRQFWDGRAGGLELQAMGPMSARIEMRGDAFETAAGDGYGSDFLTEEMILDSLVRRLRAIPEYDSLFRLAFPIEAVAQDQGVRGSVIDPFSLTRAIAAFERELVTRNSAFDRYVAGDDEALTAGQKKGLEIFHTKARCSACHSGPMFSDFSLVVHGTPQEGNGGGIISGDDLGREEFTRREIDRHAFKTPSLRNAELTAPYMHDGVFETLEMVIDFYNDGCRPRHVAVSDMRLDERLRQPLNLSADERSALIEFIRALSDPGTALDPLLLSIPERVPSGLTPVFGMSGTDKSSRIEPQ